VRTFPPFSGRPPHARMWDAPVQSGSNARLAGASRRDCVMFLRSSLHVSGEDVARSADALRSEYGLEIIAMDTSSNVRGWPVGLGGRCGGCGAAAWTWPRRGSIQLYSSSVVGRVGPACGVRPRRAARPRHVTRPLTSLARPGWYLPTRPADHVCSAPARHWLVRSPDCAVATYGEDCQYEHERSS